MSSGESGSCVGCSFLCAACRILCFVCCRRLCPCCCKPPSQEREEVNIICLGMEGAGKSTLLAVLAGESAENIQPTVGFVIKAMNTEPNLTLNIQELGGSEQIRQYWEMYYGGQHEIIFVIDSSCSEEELSQTHQVLSSCLQSPSLSSVPLLVLCTKQDMTAARSVAELKEQLKLKEIVGERPYSIHGCSASDPQSLRETVAKAITQLLRP